MDNHKMALGFLSLAYKDYLASRFLINNGFIMQGVTLASSAVEKYMKTILAVHGIYKKIHLDNLEELRQQFQKTGYSILFDKIDDVFLQILSKGYKYRYYDDKTVKTPDTIGFIVHQFLGELDYSVFLFNTLITVEDGSSNNNLNPYNHDIKAQNPNLYLNNYILNKISKKEFMDRRGQAYGLHISPQFLGTEVEIKGNNVEGKYEGKMWVVSVSNGS